MTTTTTVSRHTPEQIEAFTQRWAGDHWYDGEYWKEEFHRVGATERDFREWLTKEHPADEF